MRENPFITEFIGINTAELIRLHNLLSGGYWLGRVRKELNLRTVHESEAIRKGVGAWGWDVISGNYKR